MVARKTVSIPSHDDKLPTRSASPSKASQPLSDDHRNASNRLEQFIQDVTADVRDLTQFYNITISPTRIQRLGEYFTQRQNELVTNFRSEWDGLTTGARVDWLLIRTYLRRWQEQLRRDWAQIKDLEPLLQSWATGLIDLCEKRQKLVRVEPQEAARVLADSKRAIDTLESSIKANELKHTVSKFTAYRAVNAIVELEARLNEWHGFYSRYDPSFDWWVEQEWKQLPEKLQTLTATIRLQLVGIGSGDEDAIVGQPQGRESILAELRNEVIPYSPEEITGIGESEYKWCEKEMIKASREMGYGQDWHKALEHVKTKYVDPGQQIYLVRDLSDEAVQYVTKHDMVTVPEIVNETWRTYMISPEKQKANPFFLGGPYMQISYPTQSMAYGDRMMIMRGNNRHFSRSTVFHELIPGHHLQWYYMDRYNTYRTAFFTPFWTEGWAFYFEMILWDHGFASTPEERIGMLFWRMHRCLRIIFSLKFHLGQMTPEQCIDLLVEKGGHERATAEGEVRRSFNGDYSPLYQAGYMLGALQFYHLRRELVDKGLMKEKDFHDRILRENQMPVEMLRAILKGDKLDWDHDSSWRFHDSR